MYKEASFPPHYREAEVRQVMDAIFKLRSIAITGLAGMGKSNVVRFIVSHPQVRPRYLGDRANDYAFVHVDCAGLEDYDATHVWSGIVAQLHCHPLSTVFAHPIHVSYDVRHVFEEELLGFAPVMNLVLVLDYFDRAAKKLDVKFFNHLAHLRNARGGKLCYILATRRPIGHFGELQDLLDDGCIIGPLCERDALESIQRDEARLGCTFSEAQRKWLIACSGGHPGFLKNASELLWSRGVDAHLPEEQRTHQLLRSDKVRMLCEELWNDLASEERSIVACVARGIPMPTSTDKDSVAYLERSGLLIRRDTGRDGHDVTLFCPLFQAFVRDMQPPIPGQVRIAAFPPNQAQIKTPAGTERVTLTPLLFKLLLAMTEARKVLTISEIILRVYGETAVGVADGAATQLIKRLRRALNPTVRRMTDDSAYDCVENIRGVGYKLNG